MNIYYSFHLRYRDIFNKCPKTHIYMLEIKEDKMNEVSIPRKKVRAIKKS